MKISRIKTKGMEELRRICGDSGNKHGGKEKKSDMAVCKKAEIQYRLHFYEGAIFNFGRVFGVKKNVYFVNTQYHVYIRLTTGSMGFSNIFICNSSFFNLFKQKLVLFLVFIFGKKLNPDS